MSLLGKLALSFSGFSLIIMVLTQWILGGWLPFLTIFLILFFVGLLLALIVDYRLYLGFLTIRTTKNGISMGLSILLTIILCFSVGYISTQFDVSIDITEEKINSLSPQTTQILAGLEDDIYMHVFYKDGAGVKKKELFKRNFIVFKQQHSGFKDRYYDVYLHNTLAQKYLNEMPNKTQADIFAFIEYRGKKVSVEEPFNEEEISTALIKVTRTEKKKIYILTGHGERSSSEENASGISKMKGALLRSSFEVEPWSFILNGPLPKDTAAVLIIGPERPYLEKEIKWLEAYLGQGGRMLLALDPDRKHNLSALTNKFGVNYKNYYIIDRIAAVMGLSQTSPLGVNFDSQHPITKSLSSGAFIIFHIASNLEVIDTNKDYAVTELVKTNIHSLAIAELTQGAQAKGSRSAYTLGVAVREKAEASNSTKDTQNQESKMLLAIFGDSDFMTNKFFNSSSSLNRDLVMNTVSWLVEESDLINIRPKKLKTTQLTLKKSDQMGLVLFSIVIPCSLFIIGFIIWFRRREA